MKRRRVGQAPGSITPVYEGPEVLTALLGRAGSPHDAEEVAAAFSRALAAGEARSAVIPGLFPQEPHFESPDDARRLYANLFGLWARLAAGLGPHDDAPDVLPEPPPPPALPLHGTTPGDTVPPATVEAVWRYLAGAPPREVRRRRDRFENAQPDLVAWLQASPLPASGTVAALDLAFEAWAMLDQAFGDRVGSVPFQALREREAEPPPLQETQPGIAPYVAEQLDNLADEDPAFGPEERAQVEKTLANVVAAFTDLLRAGG